MIKISFTFLLAYMILLINNAFSGQEMTNNKTSIDEITNILKNKEFKPKSNTNKVYASTEKELLEWGLKSLKDFTKMVINVKLKQVDGNVIDIAEIVITKNRDVIINMQIDNSYEKDKLISLKDDIEKFNAVKIEIAGFANDSHWRGILYAPRNSDYFLSAIEKYLESMGFIVEGIPVNE